MRKSCAYFYCKLDNGMDFTSASTLGTDGKYYLRKKDIFNRDLRYDPSLGILEVGNRHSCSEWQVYENCLYDVKTWRA